MRAPAPWLVLAVGNDARGDDALGPALLDALRADGAEQGGAVELMFDLQLQVEHALDLQGRRGVLFVDAARPGHVQGAVLAPLAAAAQPPAASHALGPDAVLHVAERVCGAAPPAWLLAIEGEAFELGAPLSAAARTHLAAALALARHWLHAHAGGAAARLPHADDGRATAVPAAPAEPAQTRP